jgi:hypothetical protein
VLVTRSFCEGGDSRFVEQKGKEKMHSQRKAATLASSQDDSDGLDVMPSVCTPIQMRKKEERTQRASVICHAFSEKKIYLCSRCLMATTYASRGDARISHRVN